MPGHSLNYTQTIHQSSPFDNISKLDAKKKKIKKNPKLVMPQQFYEWKKDSISPEVLALPIQNLKRFA